MDIKEIQREIREWIDREERAGRKVDARRVGAYMRLLTQRHNNAAREEFNGLSPHEMQEILYHPFSPECVVGINHLSQEQCEKIPLVRQALFLLRTLSEKELKLTKLGWLPLKVVAEAYPLGQPDEMVDNFLKRINEHDAKSVWMARLTIEILGWVKTRKGMLSLTAKGKKALTDNENAGNQILRCALTEAPLHQFDLYEETSIGNFGRPYSVWLLYKFGSEWRPDVFYEELYEKAFHFPGNYNAFGGRVLSRLFYWLGIVETRINEEARYPYREEYRKTDLLEMIFTFKKP